MTMTNQSDYKSTNLPIFLLIITLSLTLVLSACGPSIPRNELRDLPAMIEIIGMDLATNQLKIRVSHRDSKTREGGHLSCQLAFKNYTPIQFDSIKLPSMTNYAIETINVPMPADERTATLDGHKQLPYVLDCYLISDNFRQERPIKKGILYQVPGNTSQFR